MAAKPYVVSELYVGTPASKVIDSLGQWCGVISTTQAATVGSLDVGTNGVSELNRHLKVWSGVVDKYLDLFCNADTGCGMTGPAGGTMSITSGYALNLATGSNQNILLAPNGTGKVGVGAAASSPSALLHVKSTAGGAGSGLRVETSSTTTYATIDYLNDLGGTGFQTGIYSSLFATTANRNHAFFYNSLTGGGIIFFTQGTERLRITSGGDLQVAGVTRLDASGNATLASITCNLPTSDPHVLGQFWRNAGIVTVSAG